MKIHSIHNQRIGRQVSRLLAFCGAALLGFTTCSVAQAQGGFLDRLTAGDGSEISLPSATAGGEVNFGNEAFRVVKSSAVRTAADQGESGSIQQTGLLSCRSCGTSCGGSCGGSHRRSACGSCGTSCGGACGVACGSCGTSCGGACGGGYSSYSSGSFGNACGIPCDPYWFATVEGLYISREGDERFTRSAEFTMGDFDFEWAPRVTIGKVPDCVHGCEVTFTGVFEWDRAASRTGAGLGTLLIPGLPIPASDLSSFTNASFQSQTYKTEYYSIEANRTLVGWDVSKVLYGIRYIDYDEEYIYNSASGGLAGVLRSDVTNALIGLQGGLDLLFPISEHGYMDFRGRAGVFVDFAESDVRLINANVDQIITAIDDDEELAGLIEIGGGVRYQVGPALSLRAGAELWYLAGVATAIDQIRDRVVRPTFGRRTDIDDEIFFVGVTAGAELRF